MAAGVSAALGLVALMGWYMHTLSLNQMRPAFVPMRYNTALGFLLGGAGLLVLVAFFGYFSGGDTAYGWGQLTRIAVHTSVEFMVLGTGVFAQALLDPVLSTSGGLCDGCLRRRGEDLWSLRGRVEA